MIASGLSLLILGQESTYKFVIRLYILLDSLLEIGMFK